MYIEEFKSNEEIIEQYQIAAETLDGANILLAWYGYGDYCGSSLVIYEKYGLLYEVNASHCSCSGLEGQWDPEETSWAALAMRKLDHIGSSGCEGGNIAQAELQKLIDQHKEDRGNNQ